MKNHEIVVSNAREHNLKNINIKIPRKSLTVITGLSGSGKSSLAFDTIYAEGHRRYVESLSSYARQFIDILKKPEVENIDGLSPSIAINQKTISHSPRSTVGTVTDIYNYLRLLYTKVGVPYCYKCGEKISSMKLKDIVEKYNNIPDGKKLIILSPLVRSRKGEYSKLLNKLQTEGYSKVRIDGKTYDLSDKIELDKNKEHTIDLYIDKLISKKGNENRLSDSIQLALKLSDGLLKIEPEEQSPVIISTKYSCINCGISYPEIEPRTFSFNSPYGACKTCLGLGYITNNTEDENGYINEEKHICPDCKGKRLRMESLAVKINNKSIYDLSVMDVNQLISTLQNFAFKGPEKIIAEKIINEILERLHFINNVGLGYMSLSRQASSLSGGEAQRVRLATQLGASLTGVLYVLDEPSIGLHPRDNNRLIKTLEKLRDSGNTVIVVEHDEETIRAADHIVDLGPGAGTHGGYIVAQGDINSITANSKSLTGMYLSSQLKIQVPKTTKKPGKEFIKIHKANTNNLKNIDVAFPKGLFTCVTGVSGSGKSSLVIDTLFPLLYEALVSGNPGKLKNKITGIDDIEKVVDIDQSPIGKTPRSNPATYTGFYSDIRNLLAMVPDSRAKAYNSGRFSFNVAGGRCDACEGQGMLKMEMKFMPDVFVTCDACNGKKFNRETLEIRYKGKNIADILEMTVEEGMSFFLNIKKVHKTLQIMNNIGLGYIKLGQPAPTLSGGEAQRIKLARELVKRSSGKNIYIMDEPTTGLHFDDVRKLLKVIHELKEQGNTVIVIEHNLEVIKTADYIIDIGPEGGEAGGYIVAQGTPGEIINIKASYTGQYLKEKLRQL